MRDQIPKFNTPEDRAPEHQTPKERNPDARTPEVAASEDQTPKEKTPQLKVASVEMDRPDFNFPIAVVIVPEFAPDDPRAGIPRSQQGAPGVYRVTFVLSIPGKDVFRGDVNLETFLASGTSLLYVSKGTTIKVDVVSETGSASALFSPDAKGALAVAQTRVSASSFVDAQRLAYHIVMPILSWWSFRFDVALDIAGYEVLEEATDSRKFVYGVLGRPKALSLDTSTTIPLSTARFRSIFSAYRDALNATNPFYRFLSLYRVIEGVRKLRNERREQILTAGGRYRAPDERIPLREVDVPYNDLLLRHFFKPYLNKKFTWVLDQFRDVIRNATAHLDPTAEDLNPDNFDDVVKCEDALPVIKYIAWQMIKTEIRADPLVGQSNLI